MKHKYADVIKAWADGASIQYRAINNDQDVWQDVENPNFHIDVFEWRVKPTTERMAMVEKAIYYDPKTKEIDFDFTKGKSIRFVFDSETGKPIYVELIK
jgi:hypothetical protein